MNHEPCSNWTQPFTTFDLADYYQPTAIDLEVLQPAAIALIIFSPIQ